METEATAQGGWSSLPADLVNSIAECLLAINDLDYYMDLRAVCHGWRSCTADPKTSRDARFHPTQWIVLDELSESDTRLFVNATTGRFLRRSLPLLRDYHLVTSTTGGFLVLADKEPPHAARVLNPITGSLIRFKAPVPFETQMAADVVGAGSPRLVLLNSLSNEFKFFIADPDTEQFYVVSPDTSTGSVALAPSLQCHDMSAESDAHEVALVPIVSSFLVLRRLAVKIGPGEMLQVRRSPQQAVCLFRMSSPGRKMERVYSICGRALFLGKRFISIHADSFPSINANCIYYKQDGSTHIYMYDLAHDVEERIAESNIYIYPASIIQLLLEYTVCSPQYLPGWDQFMKGIVQDLEELDELDDSE